MPNYSRDLLFGQWHQTSIDSNGDQLSEYAQIAPDGYFEFTFIFHDKHGEVIKQITEIGTWGLVGDIHFTATQGEIINDEHYPVDLNDPDNYNAYRVIELTNQIFRYQHVITEEIFTSRRINIDVGYG